MIILFSPAEGNFNRVRVFVWLEKAVKSVFDSHRGWELDAVLIGYDPEQNHHDVVLIKRNGEIKHLINGTEQPPHEGDFRVPWEHGDNILNQVITGLWGGRGRRVAYMQLFWKKDGSTTKDHLAHIDEE